MTKTFLKAWSLLPYVAANLVKVDVNTRVDKSVLPGSLSSGDEFSVALMSDTQLGMYDTYQRGNDGSDWKVELETFEDALDDIEDIEPAVKFVAITGDIVNQNPLGAVGTGTTYNPSLNADQVTAIQQAMNDDHARIPIYVIPGNHDIGNTFNTTSIENWYKNWGADYYIVSAPNTMFLFLNTQHFLNKNQPGMKSFYDAQWTWIEAQLEQFLAQSNLNTLVVLSHYPCYLDRIDEPESYDNWPIVDRQRFFDKVNAFPSSKRLRMHSGHTHLKIDTNDQLQNNNALTTTKRLDEFGDYVGWQQNVDGGIELVWVTENDAQHTWFLTDLIPDQFNSVRRLGMNWLALAAIIAYF